MIKIKTVLDHPRRAYINIWALILVQSSESEPLNTANDAINRRGRKKSAFCVFVSEDSHKWKNMGKADLDQVITHL